MTATTTTCPRCRGLAELVRAFPDGGAVEDVYLHPDRQVRQTRRVRPATFYACTACEWCEEVKEQ